MGRAVTAAGVETGDIMAKSEDPKDRTASTFQKVLFFILLVYVLNLAEGIFIVVKTGQWSSLIEKLFSFLLFAIIATQSWRSLLRGRESYRRRFLESKQKVGLQDAAMFSLTWSREIYQRIPEDRKPLVKNAFILIAIAMGIAYLQFGSLLTVLLVTVLVLAGVNLLVWVVASEREEKNRIQIELETARRMQMNLMPEADPQVKGYDVSGVCVPALNVGGDLFDFVWLQREQQKLCIAVVDVSGKGMDAAFRAVYTSGAVISELQHEHNLVTAVRNLNAALFARQTRDRFVSLLMVSLDVLGRRIQHVNAGQTRPLLLRDDRVTVLKGTGPRFPLGMVEAPDYQLTEMKLRAGDRLLLFTDGVTEAMNPSGEMFGAERLTDLATTLERRALSSREMVAAVRDAVLDFSAPASQHDDITIVSVRVLA